MEEASNLGDLLVDLDDRNSGRNRVQTISLFVSVIPAAGAYAIESSDAVRFQWRQASDHRAPWLRIQAR